MCFDHLQDILTPLFLISILAHSPISFLGNLVTKSTGTPWLANETATLDSPPPYTTSKVEACENLKNPLELILT